MKPWFVYRPQQALRRARAAFARPSTGYQYLPTSWGARILADPARTIGRSIQGTGVYDLAVTETIARLVAPGDLVVDAGANIGYMSVLAAMAAGPAGTVLSFEPHPELFGILRRNIESGTGPSTARVECHHCALGAEQGTAKLQMPDGFAGNDGIATVVQHSADGAVTVDVALNTLDKVLDGRIAGLMKLDVEGYELEVLKGAKRSVQERRIRHIVFEDHSIEGSEVVRLLRDAGYAVLALGWNLRGPVARELDRGRVAEAYEAPNYLATLDVDSASRLLGPRGWRSLRTLRSAVAS